MLFHSFAFALFLPAVFMLHEWVGRNVKSRQNLILIAASYVFYGWWDYRFLFLLAFSTWLDFFTGMRIHAAQTDSKRKRWLFISVGTNLGLLALFKYFNFFTASFHALLLRAGIPSDPVTLNLILPVGISFYTFHGLSYVLDIWKRRTEPVRNFIDYSLFVSFFPLLVAGPIERATHLLPQLQKARTFHLPLATDGLRQFLWGCFKKLVIADTCAPFVNDIFSNPEMHTTGGLLAGACLFSVQIYGDFSGYSDMASGTSKVFGIHLIRNFRQPYFSRDIAEFWRRWHISLSSWFRDYVYIPLGGSHGSRIQQIRNTFIIFLLSGFWHGANWTFLVWGFIHACLFLPLLLSKRHRTHRDDISASRWLPVSGDILKMLFTFSCVTLAWIFFRADNLHHALTFFDALIHPGTQTAGIPVLLAANIFLLFLTEWLTRNSEHPLMLADRIPRRVIRYGLYYLIAALVMYYAGGEGQFIYFQF